MTSLWQKVLPLYAVWFGLLTATQSYAAVGDNSAQTNVPPGTITTIIIETRKHTPDHVDRRYRRDGLPSNSNLCCRAGMTLPIEYRSNENTIDADHYPQLSQPTRYQQWVRINNQYILLNVLTHTVIKVVVLRD